MRGFVATCSMRRVPVGAKFPKVRVVETEAEARELLAGHHRTCVTLYQYPNGCPGAHEVFEVTESDLEVWDAAVADESALTVEGFAATVEVAKHIPITGEVEDV